MNRHVSPRGWRVGCLFAFALVGVVLSPDRNAQAQIGTPMLDAQVSNLFDYVRNGPSRRIGLPRGRVVTVRRPWDDDRAFITMLITTDRHDRIESVELRLARSFVDAPSSECPARSMVAHLIAHAVEPTDRAKADPLADEIAPTEPRCFRRGAPTTQWLPLVRSRCFEVFRGHQPRCELVLPASRVQLENTVRRGVRVLRVYVTARGRP